MPVLPCWLVNHWREMLWLCSVLLSASSIKKRWKSIKISVRQRRMAIKWKGFLPQHWNIFTLLLFPVSRSHLQRIRQLTITSFQKLRKRWLPVLWPIRHLLPLFWRRPDIRKKHWSLLPLWRSFWQRRMNRVCSLLSMRIRIHGVVCKSRHMWWWWKPLNLFPAIRQR